MKYKEQLDQAEKMKRAGVDKTSQKVYNLLLEDGDAEFKLRSHYYDLYDQSGDSSNMTESG
jgi:hypothetical protein